MADVVIDNIIILFYFSVVKHTKLLIVDTVLFISYKAPNARTPLSECEWMITSLVHVDQMISHVFEFFSMFSFAVLTKQW